jgi:5-methylcytosine-specific restriction protein A
MRTCRGGCGKAVSSGYCDKCRAKGAAKESRPTSTQRGYGYRWQQTSKGYLRAHPLAVDIFHEHKGRVMLAQVVDHIKPHRGDMALFWDPNNWQGLTKADHDRKTATEDGGFGHYR